MVSIRRQAWMTVQFHHNDVRSNFMRLCLHKLNLSPDKSQFGAARVHFLWNIISEDSLRYNDDRVSTISRMPIHSDIKQLRSLYGGLSYCRTFLPDMSRRKCPITALLK